MRPQPFMLSARYMSTARARTNIINRAAEGKRFNAHNYIAVVFMIIQDENFNNAKNILCNYICLWTMDYHNCRYLVATATRTDTNDTIMKKKRIKVKFPT